MCLKITNGYISYISFVGVGRHQLVGGAPGIYYTSLKFLTYFVIQDLNINFMSMISQAIHD